MTLPGLVAANNLSDVVDRETTWDNLGRNVSIEFELFPGTVSAEATPPFVPITISGYDAIDREGAVSLWINASSREYAISTNSGATFTTVIRTGNPVVEGQFGAAVPLAAETIEGVNQILWRLSPTTLTIWTLDASWVFVSQTSAITINNDTLNTEVTFRSDINGDGILGEDRVLIEAGGAGSTLIYIGDISRRYFVSSNAGATFTTVIRTGSPVIEGQFGAGVVPLAAENIGGINQILWDLNNGTVLTWNLDDDWVFQSQSAPITIGPNTVDLEIAFRTDINDDGVTFSIKGRDILALEGIHDTSVRDFVFIKGLSSAAQPRLTTAATTTSSLLTVRNNALPKIAPVSSGNYFFSSGVTLSGNTTRINGTNALSIATSPFSGSTATAPLLLRELRPQSNWRITEPMPSGTITSPDLALPFETDDFVFFMKAGQS